MLVGVGGVPGPERLMPSKAQVGRRCRLPCAPGAAAEPGTWPGRLSSAWGVVSWAVSARAQEPGALRTPPTAFIVFPGACLAVAACGIAPTSQLRQILMLWEQGGSSQVPSLPRELCDAWRFTVPLCSYQRPGTLCSSPGVFC